MARLIKLPPELRDWKVDSLVKSDGECEIYKAVKEGENGGTVNAVLRVLNLDKDSYTEDRAAFFEEEADFVASLQELGNVSNYLDVYIQNNPSKLSCSLYIFTEDLQNLETVMKQKEFSQEEIVDFGIKLSTILEKLENENIFHGNIAPRNIYVTPNGEYHLGGFSDLESKIEGPSFMSPEVYKHEQADFTTDIYSLGIIMYVMSNGGKLPFESEDVSKKSANEQRLSGKPISAPANGNEKLKSVIVIACQADNSVRWKNAGNIKNALNSIKNEIDEEKTDTSVAVPENTELESNEADHDDYEYEEISSTESQNEKNGGDKAFAADFAGTAAALFKNADKSDDNADNITDGDDSESKTDIESDDSVNKVESEISDSGDSYAQPAPIESADVFDDYAVGEKRNTFAAKRKLASQKDYGDYFEDEPVKSSDVSSTANDSSSANDSSDFVSSTDGDSTEFDKNAFDFVDSTGKSTGKHANAKKKGKGKVIAVVAVCVVVLAAAGAIGYAIYSNMSKNTNGGSTSDTAVAASSSAAAETSASQQATTAPATTSPSTTKPSDSTAASSSSSSSSSDSNSTDSQSGGGSSNGTVVTSVLGYTYENAKQTLESQGFNVEIWGYQYSKYYGEGYIMSQTPEGDQSVSSGSTVYLMISRGLVSQQNSDTNSSDSSSSSSSGSQSSGSSGSQNSAGSGSTNNSNSDYIFANSASSYLSSSQIKSLSDDKLQLAINEIYARHGRIFKDSSINSYFKSKSWYEGKYTADEFAKYVTFNEYEQKNLQLLINERNSRR